MEIGMVGLGRMGRNMATRLVRGGHRVVGYDPNPKAAAAAGEADIEVAESRVHLVDALPVPRVVWVMVPAG